jgi:hypothetical protein
MDHRMDLGKVFGRSSVHPPWVDVNCLVLLNGRLRIKHLSEAMAKLNKIQNMLQTRKRSRPESSTQEQASLAVASSGHMTTTTHGKVSSSVVPNHVSTLDIISGASRAGDKNKNGTNPNKRVRTSIADVRVCICKPCVNPKVSGLRLSLLIHDIVQVLASIYSNILTAVGKNCSSRVVPAI